MNQMEFMDYLRKECERRQNKLPSRLYGDDCKNQVYQEVIAILDAYKEGAYANRA